jgi:hypothetical protein
LLRNIPRIQKETNYRDIHPMGRVDFNKAVRQEVNDVVAMLLSLRDGGLTTERRVSLPVDVYKVASLLGLGIVEVEELGGVKLNNPWAAKDIKVPGCLDRRARTIFVCKNTSVGEQWMTIGHEIGHWLFDSEATELRERYGKKTPLADRRPSFRERRAERFTIELTMPEDSVREQWLLRFGSPIDGTVPREALAHFLGQGARRKLTAHQLAAMGPFGRACLVSEAVSFGGPLFEPLIALFKVPTQEFARRVLELELMS